MIQLTTTRILPPPALGDWCKADDLSAGTQKRFGGMMGERFKRDANNGYPRYIGVRAKPSVPILKVVSSH